MSGGWGFILIHGSISTRGWKKGISQGRDFNWKEEKDTTHLGVKL